MNATYGFGTALLAVLLSGTAAASGGLDVGATRECAASTASAAGAEASRVVDVAPHAAEEARTGAADTGMNDAGDMEEIVVTGEYPASARFDRSVLEAPVPEDVKLELQRSLDAALAVRLTAKLAL